MKKRRGERGTRDGCNLGKRQTKGGARKRTKVKGYLRGEVWKGGEESVGTGG